MSDKLYSILFLNFGSELRLGSAFLFCNAQVTLVYFLAEKTWNKKAYAQKCTI